MAEYTSKAFRERNRPMPKMTKAALERAIAASQRIHAISTEIRAHHGLPPVPESIALQLAHARRAEFSTPARSAHRPAHESVHTPLRELSGRFHAQLADATDLITGDPLMKAYREEAADWLGSIGAELDRAAAYSESG
jgi:hypothetical protein